ncbi:hypothetical protein [Dehalobacterium formicoaceticum]|uniref:Uncharacterized protein n=1 Tax=Dehalobacterium formicoaceticum TaxID=51515 RepID=A0ABT1Y279_9FIRM|nr:hypothetical protein [Dehalobacterium formicoaceticum]MCR6544591.1 hypothetical protein [Dehalobacterium formicoaceticum]
MKKSVLTKIIILTGILMVSLSAVAFAVSFTMKGNSYVSSVMMRANTETSNMVYSVYVKGDFYKDGVLFYNQSERKAYDSTASVQVIRPSGMGLYKTVGFHSAYDATGSLTDNSSASDYFNF